MRRHLKSLLTVTLLGATLAPGAAAQAPASALQWKPCSEEQLKELQCATLQVPLDHAKPQGEQITLALSRRVHTTPSSRGVILIQPGGPGFAGRELAETGASVKHGVGNSYDWIGIDSRGMGASRPAADCKVKARSVDPTKPAAWLSAARAFVRACERSPSARLMPHMRTSDIVTDYELVRRALGVEKISFFGISYGTIVGQAYALRYPDRVERMLLDGVADARSSWYTIGRRQRQGLERNAYALFDWMARHGERYKLGRDGRALRRRVIARYRTLIGGTERQRAQAQQVLASLQAAAMSTGNWSMVAPGLAGWLKRGTTPRFSLPGATPSVMVANRFVTCSEAGSPRYDRIVRDYRRDLRRYPLFTTPSAMGSVECVPWPRAAPPRPSGDAAKVTAPILLTSETHDGATPLVGALSVRARFPSARLIAGGPRGRSHGGGIATPGCQADAIAAFLKDGTLPARKAGRRADKVCAPAPITSMAMPKAGAGR